jgi:hypothetical protein
MFMSEMCGSTAAGDGEERAAPLSAADAASLTSHEESTGSWEQAWIDLGGEG